MLLKDSCLVIFGVSADPKLKKKKKIVTGLLT